MRHVLVINQFALPRSQGGGTRHVDLFSRLEGWSPLIIAGHRNHYSQMVFDTDDPMFRLVRVPQQSGGAFARLVGWIVFAIQALTVGLTRRSVDLVFGSSPQPLAALAGLLTARARRVPFILEVRDLWPESAVAAGRLRRGSPGYSIFRWIEGVLVRGASRIVCVTDGWQEHFVQLGASTERILVVPNGAEPADFQVPESREEVRGRYRVTGFTAVFAGAHGPKDGTDLILDAAERLPQIHFLLVGSGPVKARAVNRAQQQGLYNVEFREPVSKQELPALLRACDVGIHAVTPMPVFERGMSPNKLFDYMAAGLPVVSNAQQALGRIMQDGECGRLGGAHDLASCLQAVHQSPSAQRETWGRRSISIVSQRFSRSAAAHVLENAFDELVKARLNGLAKLQHEGRSA